MIARRMVTVTCGGCGKTGKTPAAEVPPNSVPLCPDCEPRADEFFGAATRVGGTMVTEDEP